MIDAVAAELVIGRLHDLQFADRAVPVVVDVLQQIVEQRQNRVVLSRPERRQVRVDPERHDRRLPTTREHLGYDPAPPGVLDGLQGPRRRWRSWLLQVISVERALIGEELAGVFLVGAFVGAPLGQTRFELDRELDLRG